MRDSAILDTPVDVHLRQAFFLALIARGAGGHMKSLPTTVDEAVERLKSEMSLKDKVTIANMAEVELASLHSTLGSYIRNSFGLWSGNEALLTSCRFLSGNFTLDVQGASSVIIRELWKKLCQTYKLRIVK